MEDLRSSVDGVSWPAVAFGPSAALLAVTRQLEASQWWPRARIEQMQLAQLRQLLSHVEANVPYYSGRLREASLTSGTLTGLADLARLPALTRAELRDAGGEIRALRYPPSHGRAVPSTSGGSTGVPVTVMRTELDQLMWYAAHVREELWHRDDPTGTMARIRRVPPGLTEAQSAAVRSPEGLVWPNYGPPADMLWRTGKVGIMDDRVPVADQAAFLLRLHPEYLFTFPANLRLLLSHFRAGGAPTLRSVWTMSEVVDDEMRRACASVFGCRIVHNYSSAETGYIALQCPMTDSFHVQSESVLVEVVRPDGSPCGPGEVGRVLLTSLHGFATPLLRYEIGDEAEVGGPCPCGRPLPVLRRVVGRSFDYLVLPSGERRHVDTGYHGMCRVPAVREFQVVQRSVGEIEVFLVLSRALLPAEESEILGILRAEFGECFGFRLTVRDFIERTEAGKVRTFLSDLR